MGERSTAWDDLREWPLTLGEGLATVDRRAIGCIWGDARACWVQGAFGCVHLSAPYADVVAWWRGGR